MNALELAEPLYDAAVRAARAAGRDLAVDVGPLVDRSGHLPLGRPGVTSPNGSCRLVRAADGWLAVNLPRTADRDSVEAWLQVPVHTDPWSAIRRHAQHRRASDLLAQARLLGLPIARVGERRARAVTAPRRRWTAGVRSRRARLNVLDLSAMWAGPLCGALLAAAGAAVVKVESPTRPDAMRGGAPAFYRRLNGGKAELELDLSSANGRRDLLDAALSCDVLITAARPRALAQLGLEPRALFAGNPGLVWVAVTGHGLGRMTDRVAFGDDAAAAGGLVRWVTRRGRREPRFAGDALADPLTGLAAAAAAFRALRLGGGVMVDASLARTAAGVAASLGARP